tara:strand:+ start:77 stop:244 length:168 start_codon:yes stop_codon:yes gene_type:complete
MTTNVTVELKEDQARSILNILNTQVKAQGKEALLSLLEMIVAFEKVVTPESEAEE